MGQEVQSNQIPAGTATQSINSPVNTGNQTQSGMVGGNAPGTGVPGPLQVQGQAISNTVQHNVGNNGNQSTPETGQTGYPTGGYQEPQQLVGGQVFQAPMATGTPQGTTEQNIWNNQVPYSQGAQGQQTQGQTQFPQGQQTPDYQQTQFPQQGQGGFQQPQQNQGWQQPQNFQPQGQAYPGQQTPGYPGQGQGGFQPGVNQTGNPQQDQAQIPVETSTTKVTAVVKSLDKLELQPVSGFTGQPIMKIGNTEIVEILYFSTAMNSWVSVAMDTLPPRQGVISVSINTLMGQATTLG